MENYLVHYGIKRRSGRYPYGSGARPYQGEGGSGKIVDPEAAARRKQKIKKVVKTAAIIGGIGAAAIGGMALNSMFLSAPTAIISTGMEFINKIVNGSSIDKIQLFGPRSFDLPTPSFGSTFSTVVKNGKVYVNGVLVDTFD